MEPDIKGVRWAFLLVGVADGTLLPFIPLYLLEQGLSATAIGAVLAGMAVVWFFAALICGYVADRRFRPERILLVGTAAASVLGMALALGGDGASLAVLILILTLVRSPLTLLDAIALRRLQRASRTGYARIRLLMSAGWAGSAIASGLAYHFFGLRLIPFLYGPLTAVVALAVWRSVKPNIVVADVTSSDLLPGPVRLKGIPFAMVGFLVSAFLLGVSLAATQKLRHAADRHSRRRRPARWCRGGLPIADRDPDHGIYACPFPSPEPQSPVRDRMWNLSSRVPGVGCDFESADCCAPETRGRGWIRPYVCRIGDDCK